MWVLSHAGAAHERSGNVRPSQAVFWYIVLCQPLAIVLFRHLAPHDTKVDGKSYAQSSMAGSLRDWRSWLVKMIPFLLVNVMSHFVMESVLPAVFNTYNAHQVALKGPTDTSVLMKKTWFLVVLSICMAIGDMSSRRIGYMFEITTTKSNYLALLFALVCSSSGLYLTTKAHSARERRGLRARPEPHRPEMALRTHRVDAAASRGPPCSAARLRVCRQPPGREMLLAGIDVAQGSSAKQAQQPPTREPQRQHAEAKPGRAQQLDACVRRHGGRCGALVCMSCFSI